MGGATEYPDTDARRRGRARLAAVGLLVAATLVVVVLAFVPRTIAQGGEGTSAWRVQATAGILTPRVSFEGPGADPASTSGSELSATAVWHVAAGTSAGAVTIVAGATPGGAASVRVATDERGVGEARVQRLLWRRFHVTVLPGELWVTELVAISASGEVREVVSEMPPPPAA